MKPTLKLLAFVALTSIVGAIIGIKPLRAHGSNRGASPLANFTITKTNSGYVNLGNKDNIIYKKLLYIANSSETPDYKMLVNAFTQKYRQTTNVFAKHDIFAKQKTNIIKVLHKIQGSPNFIWTSDVSLPNTGTISHYNFKKKGYNIHVLEDTFAPVHVDNSNYGILFKNRNRFTFLPTTSEDAKTIESIMQEINADIYGHSVYGDKIPKLLLRVFAKVTGANTKPFHSGGIMVVEGRKVVANIIKIELVEKVNGKEHVLLEYAGA